VQPVDAQPVGVACRVFVEQDEAEIFQLKADQVLIEVIEATAPGRDDAQRRDRRDQPDFAIGKIADRFFGDCADPSGARLVNTRTTNPIRKTSV
jgi:hypothetical protein